MKRLFSSLVVFLMFALPVNAEIVPLVRNVVRTEQKAASNLVKSAAAAAEKAAYNAVGAGVNVLPQAEIDSKLLREKIVRNIHARTVARRRRNLAVQAAIARRKQEAAISTVQRTLVLIKPDAIEQRISGIILDRLDKLGLQLVAAKVASPTEGMIRAHYKHLVGTPFIDGVVDYMLGEYNNAPKHTIYAFVFQGEDAIAKVRAEIGSTVPEKADPNTIRGSYGRTVNGIIQNCVHASGAPEEAEEEIALWFGSDEVPNF